MSGIYQVKSGVPAIKEHGFDAREKTEVLNKFFALMFRKEDVEKSSVTSYCTDMFEKKLSDVFKAVGPHAMHNCSLFTCSEVLASPC